MEDSSQKMNESKSNDLINVPDTSSEKFKENLEKKIQKQNVDANLKNIKSEYTIKILFFHLDEKIKLKLIKYDKNLQNTIDINLNNYKFFSGRYIEFEADGKGKEYYGYNDELKFEGEYLNGERNGKGKEYNFKNGKLIFEGEYLNGVRLSGKIFDIKTNMYYDLEKINGLFNEYYDNGRLEFEGEYLNGKRNGKGKEYYSNGKLKFEGEYLNGDRLSGKIYDIKTKIII